VGIESVTATVEKQKCTVNPEDDCIIYLSQVSLMAWQTFTAVTKKPTATSSHTLMQQPTAIKMQMGLSGAQFLAQNQICKSVM